jgi:hypothetical protein|tara:strand:- start:1245 stop:3446 length:2202 start_codon:yes stop_codon:yes gene_type:complete
MIKQIIKTLLFLLLMLVAIVLYLSFFGIKTNLFNDRIKSEVLNINKIATLEVNNVKLLLDPLNLSINVKIFDPEILINNSKLELEFIISNISLKSFINKEFSIDDLQISTKAIKIKDLVLLSRSFKNSAELFLLDNIIKEGLIVGDIKLNFDNNGKIKDDYEVKGFVKKGSFDFFKKHSINNLKFIFNIKEKKYLIEDMEGIFNQIKLSSPLIKIKEENNQFLINGKLVNKRDNIDLKTLNSLILNDQKDYNIENINLSTESNFTFAINKKLKISDFKFKSIVDLTKLVYKNNFSNIKNYLPSFDKKIILENHKIFINYEKNKLDISGKGNVKINDKVDNLNYKLIKKNDQYFFDINIGVKKNSLLINALEYKKNENQDSLLKLKGVIKKKNQIKFDLISFNEKDNNFLIEGLDLNDNLDILDIKKLELNYINNNKIKNQIQIKKINKRYQVNGASFDLSKVISRILNGESEKPSRVFSNLISNFDVKIKKIYIDKDTFVNDLKGFIIFKNNKIDKLDLNSTFLNNKKLNLTINTNKENEKITTISSNNPKPLVAQYKFIKGFEEGVLDFYSIEKNGTSNSLLSIDNFKIQEVPVLAKLLSLASLQGISDLLTGEGIRFTSFEMKFSNEKKLMKIEELYAIGPAISILMDGYIQNKKLISLRGTLVPATTINRSIASIPLLGKILVGEKSGEGVFGVSFKIKGPPKNLKTSVNPIKTLTPRFITRTLEKIKKN